MSQCTKTSFLNHQQRAIDLPLIQQQGRSFSAAADDENPFADSSSHPSKRTPPSNTLDMSSNASSESDAQQHQQRLYNPAESMSGPAISRAASNQSHETSPNHNNLTQSPLSPQSTTIQDDWQSQLSPSSHAASHPDESDGEAWIQLTDSRSTTPLSPLSPSWDTNELARDLR